MNVLIIYPDAFELGWLGSTKPVFKLAETLIKNGSRIILLAKNDKLTANTDIDKIFPGEIIRTRHSGSYIKFIENNYFLKRLTRAIWKIFGENFYWNKLHVGWARKINPEFINKKLKEFNFKPDIIWSVTGGYLDAAYAGSKLSNYYNIPWVFELHDPPRHAGLGYDVTTVVNQFNFLLDKSSKIVVGSEIYKNELISKKKIDSKKIELIYLSYLIQDVKERKNRTTIFTLSYTGSLSGKRTIIPLIKAIKLMEKNNQISTENFKLIIAGNGAGILEAKSICSQLNLNNLVSILGEVSKNEADRITSESDVIVVIQAKESRLQIPGKLFESLQWNKILLGMMPENIEAATIIKDNSLGKVCSPDNPIEIYTTLTELHKQFQNNTLGTNNTTISIDNFTKQTFEKKTIEIINKLLC